MRTPIRVFTGVLVFPFSLVAFLALAHTEALSAELGNDPAPVRTITERGAHHRVLQRDNFITTTDERQINQPVRVVELATGLHYLDAGEWKESRDEIEIVATGAAATKGQHKVHFNGNINTLNAITITLPDDQTMQSRPLCLAFTDPATGQSTIIAELQDSVGILLPPNQVLYPGAFSGDGVLADIRLNYTRRALNPMSFSGRDWLCPQTGTKKPLCSKCGMNS